jgi:hypothetical protein
MITNRRMIDRLISAGIAVVLGFLVWLYARSRDQEMLDNAPIPVQITLAPGQADSYDVETTGPRQIVASFAGPPSRMRELRSMLQHGELHVQVTLTVPPDRLQESRYLDTVRIDAADIRTPPGVRAIIAEDRNRIPVTLRRLVERRLPVRVDCAPDEPIAQVVAEPNSVVVRGPQEILDRTRAMPTQPYVMLSRPEASALQDVIQTTSVPLVQELDGRPVRTRPEAVTVRLTLRPRQRIYELVDVPVQFLLPANFALKPQWENDRSGKITVRVLGPAGEDTPSVTAFIDLTGRKFEPGLYADEPLRLQLPKDFQLAQNPPRSAAFRLSPVTGERIDSGVLGGVRTP